MDDEEQSAAELDSSARSRADRRLQGPGCDRQILVGTYAARLGAPTRRSDEGGRLARSGGGVRGKRQQRAEGGHGPLRAPRAGDRSAPTVISLALDEVDATAVLTGATGLSVSRELRLTSPYDRVVAEGLIRRQMIRRSPSRPSARPSRLTRVIPSSPERSSALGGSRRSLSRNPIVQRRALLHRRADAAVWRPRGERWNQPAAGGRGPPAEGVAFGRFL